jgi:hypothetical protein
MRKIATTALVLAFALLSATPALAHQPVVLLDTDTTAAKGPLLVDGTISFAVRAAFTKAGQKKAFRAALKEGDEIAVEYLIVDKKPENTLKNAMLPQVIITAPSGAKYIMKINERTKFFEPFGRTNYLYLARYTAPAEAGIYSITISSRAKSAITLAVGKKEIPGEVRRGAATSATPSATPSAKASATATATPSAAPSATKAGYTMADVKAKNTPAKCWTAVDGFVYDLTSWIASHPGGSSSIKSLCGTDGTSAFASQHGSARTPNQRLDSYLLGPLTK